MKSKASKTKTRTKAGRTASLRSGPLVRPSDSEMLDWLSVYGRVHTVCYCSVVKTYRIISCECHDTPATVGKTLRECIAKAIPIIAKPNKPDEERPAGRNS